MIAFGAAAAVIALFGAGVIFGQHRYNDRAIFLLPTWGAAVVYIVARSCAGDAGPWVKAQRAVAAAIAAVVAIDVVIDRGGVDRLLDYAQVYGWGWIYIPEYWQKILLMVAAVAWFSLAGIWTWCRAIRLDRGKLAAGAKAVEDV